MIEMSLPCDPVTLSLPYKNQTILGLKFSLLNLLHISSNKNQTILGLKSNITSSVEAVYCIKIRLYYDWNVSTGMGVNLFLTDKNQTILGLKSNYCKTCTITGKK